MADVLQKFAKEKGISINALNKLKQSLAKSLKVLKQFSEKTDLDASVIFEAYCKGLVKLDPNVDYAIALFKTKQALAAVDPDYAMPLNRLVGTRRKVAVVPDTSVDTAQIDIKGKIKVNPQLIAAYAEYLKLKYPKLSLKTAKGKLLLQEAQKRGIDPYIATAAAMVLAHEVKHEANGDIYSLKQSLLKNDPLYYKASNVACDLKINSAIEAEWGIPVRFGLNSSKYGAKSPITTAEATDAVFEALKNSKEGMEDLIDNLLDDTHSEENIEQAPDDIPEDQDPNEIRDENAKEAVEEGEKTAEEIKEEAKQKRQAQKMDTRGTPGKGSGQFAEMQMEVSPQDMIHWSTVLKRILQRLRNVRKVEETYTKFRPSALPIALQKRRKGTPTPVEPGWRFITEKDTPSVIIALDTSGSMLNYLPKLFGEIYKLLTRRKINLYLANLGYDKSIIAQVKDKTKAIIVQGPNKGKQVSIRKLMVEGGGTAIPKDFIEFVTSFKPKFIGVFLITDSDNFSPSPENLGRVKQLKKATKGKLGIAVPENEYDNLREVAKQLGIQISYY